MVQPTDAVLNRVENSVEETAQEVADTSLEVIEAGRDLVVQGSRQVQGWTEAVDQERPPDATNRTDADDVRSSLEASLAAVTTGLTSLNVKAVEALRVNTDASFDLWKAWIGAQTMSDAVGLGVTHMCKQMEVVGEQVRDLSGLSQQIAADALRPVRSTIRKAARLSV